MQRTVMWCSRRAGQQRQASGEQAGEQAGSKPGSRAGGGHGGLIAAQVKQLQGSAGLRRHAVSTAPASNRAHPSIHQPARDAPQTWHTLHFTKLTLPILPPCSHAVHTNPPQQGWVGMDDYVKPRRGTAPSVYGTSSLVPPTAPPRHASGLAPLAPPVPNEVRLQELLGLQRRKLHTEPGPGAYEVRREGGEGGREGYLPEPKGTGPRRKRAREGNGGEVREGKNGRRGGGGRAGGGGEGRWKLAGCPG